MFKNVSNYQHNMQFRNQMFKCEDSDMTKLHTRINSKNVKDTGSIAESQAI